MNTYKPFKKIFIRIFCIIFSLLTVLSSVNVFNARAAIDSSIKLDSSDVLSDLRSDSSFNINNYPFNEDGELQLISFNEYCYSFYSNLQANYGLYVYIYNPQCLNIVQNSMLNKIQIAVAYDENGNPTDYEKMRLQFCSVSTEPDYYRLFYKFKIANADEILSRVNSNERRYDISGIELYSEGNTNAVDHKIERTFYYTGYAAGYGPDKAAESTLTCRTEKLETVELEVEHTFWRSLTSSKGVHYQNQLDTVYFSVPNYFFENYGKLQRIKAEWYEYKTKDIVVTSNQDFYNAAKNHIGQAVNNDTLSWHLYQNLNTSAMGMSISTADWAYNDVFNVIGQTIDTLYYLFPTNNWTSIENYDPYANVTSIGGVSSNDLYNYILNYNKTYVNGRVKDGRISADLFENDIDDYRKIDNEYGKIQKGYSYYDFDADVDLFDLLAYDPAEHSSSENAVMYGWWAALLGNYSTVEESFTGLTPILVLDKDEYLSGTNQDVSDRLFVNYNDVDKIKSVYNTAKGKDETVVMFRFAVSDYYAADVDILEGSYVGPFDSTISKQAYRAWESVFLDFDIIQLTFNKNGVYKVIPVVASPIDIVDDITPPYNPPKTSLWDRILAWATLIVSIIVGLMLLWIMFTILRAVNHIGNAVVKLIFILLVLAVFGVIGYFGGTWVYGVINGFGGLL